MRRLSFRYYVAFLLHSTEHFQWTLKKNLELSLNLPFELHQQLYYFLYFFNIYSMIEKMFDWQSKIHICKKFNEKIVLPYKTRNLKIFLVLQRRCRSTFCRFKFSFACVLKRNNYFLCLNLSFKNSWIHMLNHQFKSL